MNILIVGAGETGYYIASEFSEDHNNVTVIDDDPGHLQNIQRSLNIVGILGDGTSLSVLESAGIKDTDLLISCTDHDETNLISCLLADHYGVKEKIALAKTDLFLKRSVITNYLRSGITQIINTPLITAQEIIATTSMASASEVSAFGKKNVILAGYRIKENSPWNNMMLKDIRQDTTENQFLIASIVRDGRSFIPSGQHQIQQGDYVYLLTPSHYAERLNEILGVTLSRTRKAIIAGGNKIAERIAVSLLRSHYKVTMISNDAFYTHEVQKKFSGNKNFQIKTGNFNEVKLQLKLDVSTSSVFIAVSSDDHDNILACLIAQYLGAEKTVCLINRQDLIQSIEELNFDVVISPRLAAARRIKKIIRGGKSALHYTTISETNMEVIEMVATSNSAVLNTPLKEIKLPTNSLFGAIIKNSNKVIIPSGDTKIEEGDKIIMVATGENLIKLKEMVEGVEPA